MGCFITFLVSIAIMGGIGYAVEANRPQLKRRWSQAKRRQCELDIARMKIEITHKEDKLARLKGMPASQKDDDDRRLCELDIARMKVELSHKEENLAEFTGKEQGPPQPEDPEALLVLKRRELAELEDHVQQLRNVET